MKKILFFVFICTLFLSIQAQETLDFRTIQNGFGPTRTIERATSDITPAEIQFWVGSGTNEMIAVFYWCQDSAVGLAYGYRWNGTKTIGDMLQEIDVADTRISFNISTWINSYSYLDNTFNLNIATVGMLSYTVNGLWANGLTDVLSNNDLFEMEEYGNCTTPTNVIPVSDPNGPQLPDDETISFNQIEYWVGGGPNSVVLTVNWCDTALAFAWGIHFSGDSILVADIMNTIALYDPRLTFSYGAWGITDITYQDENYNLGLAGDWWMYNVNGITALQGISQQYVKHGDLIKWGDESCGMTDANFNYVWTTPIQAVSAISNDVTLFDGIVGSDDFIAISFDDSAILGWATSCQVTRGYQDIANPTVLASYGNEQSAVGQASTSTTEVVSLGDNGSAVLTFNTPISNGNGYDFAIFENSLNDIFLELAFVEVSSDGINFFRFPAVSNTQITTQIGNASSVDARYIHNLAGKHRAGWGTPFDLDDLAGYTNLNTNQITHIRIVDAVGTINPLYGTTDRYGKIINDPYPTDFASGGFDLGGVAVLNGWTPSGITENSPLEINVYPNPCTDYVMIDNQEGKDAILYNTLGQVIKSFSISSSQEKISMQNLNSGLYYLQVGSSMIKIIKK